MEKIAKGMMIPSQSEEPFAYMPIHGNEGRYCYYSNCKHCFDIDVFSNNNNNDNNNNNSNNNSDSGNIIKSKYSCKCGYSYCNRNCYKLDINVNHHHMICKSTDSHINEFIKWCDSSSSLYLFALVVLQRIAINSIANKSNAKIDLEEFERLFSLENDNVYDNKITRKKRKKRIDTELEESYVLISILLDRSMSWKLFEFNISIDRWRQLLAIIEFHMVTASIESDVL